MSPQAITALVLLTVCAGLLAWEAYTLSNRHPEDHITAVIQNAARKNLIIPFGFGFLMGHFFW